MKYTVKSHQCGKQHTGNFEGDYYLHQSLMRDMNHYMRIQFMSSGPILIQSLKMDDYLSFSFHTDLRNSSLSDQAQEALFHTHKPGFKGSWKLITKEKYTEQVNQLIVNIKSQNQIL